MKVRYRISLWIVTAGMVSSLVIFLVAIHEIHELAYEGLDDSLKRIAHSVAATLADHPAVIPTEIPELTALNKVFMVIVYDHHHTVIYQNAAARAVDLPAPPKKHSYTAWAQPRSTTIPAAAARPETGRQCRVRRQNIGTGEQARTILVAIPLDEVEDEPLELVWLLLIGLGSSLILLVVTSYFAAGRILRPLTAINRLTREISAKTLDQRLPLGRSDDELRQLSVSLNHMFDRLQHSFAQQQQFVANASHELKTPITLLRLFLDGAVRRPELRHDFRQQLLEQEIVLQRMERLVRTLLDLSALEMKQQSGREPFDLIPLITAVLDDFEPLIDDRHLQLQCDLPPTLELKGEREGLHRVLVNLVENAIKYNHDGGRIRIAASADRNTAELTIANTGAGIPPKDRERIFEPFYRVEKSRSQQYGGTGLGLAIVKRIVALHGGTITVASEPGAWTTFCLHLPR